MVFILNVNIEKTIFVLTNQYANYQLLTKPEENQKELVINETFSSRLDKHLTGYPYIEKIKTILFHDLNIKDSTILVLGAGGFTLSAETAQHNYFIYVDMVNHLVVFLTHINNIIAQVGVVKYLYCIGNCL